ncbi:ester cyclase [Arthrobacter sp. NPDC056886]|jgi:predicted ester cyclase|uniref:ester cyclase n=1 Tax=Arthrobacter sp. NPDC056886 TaxID=3345960 RepID=UPI00366AF916
MATEITENSAETQDAIARMRDMTLPLEERFDPDFVDHDPADGQPAGGGGLAWYWEQFGTSFSDIERNVLETIVTPTKLITIMDLSGTHTGEFLGHAPTGRRFTVRNVQVVGFRDGKVVDRWGSTDELGILTQLGLV